MKRLLLKSSVFVITMVLCFILKESSVLALNDEVHYTVTGSGSGSTGVVIDWRGSDSTLQYGLTTSYGQSATGITPSIHPFSSTGPFWEASINNLSPGTVYHYKIGSNSSDFTFKTAPSIGSSGFKVDAIADVGDSGDWPNVTNVASLIKNDNPDLVLIPGDISYANSVGQQAVDMHFNDEMAWSANFKNYAAAYMVAWGNHEWDASTDDLRNYKGRFGLPNQQTSPGSPGISCCGEDWYWFDYGNVRFIAYPEPWSGAWSDWKTKASTVMDQAQNDSNIKFIVTFGHRPAYSSGYHSGDSTLASYMAVLESTHSKYVLNLNGHSHNYERTYPQSGVTHITIGTGGADLEQNAGGSACGNIWNICPAPAYTATRYMRQGTLSLVFTANGIQGSYLCGPAGGGTNDINCNQGAVIDNFTIGIPSVTNQPTASPIPIKSPSPTPGLITFGSNTLHYTANEGGASAYAAANALGFNVHDIGLSTSELSVLPANSQAMVWGGLPRENCSTSLPSAFTSFVLATATNPKVYGYYLIDEPYYNDSCVSAVTAYTKYIHDNAPGKKAMALLTDWPGTYGYYRPAVTGIDLVALDPYPVDTSGRYNETLISHEINSAVSQGVPMSAIIPVYQTFGGWGFGTPTAAQLSHLLSQWDTLVPNPPMDYAYSWDTQGGKLTDALSTRPDWQPIMAAHNNLSVTTGKQGDANGDGKVDGIDYVIWLNNYDKQMQGPANGDFNNNGFVDGIDYVVWLNNYGK